MKRTYADITGEYYDNLDKIIDLGDETDRRLYDPKRWVKEDMIKIG